MKRILLLIMTLPLSILLFSSCAAAPMVAPGTEEDYHMGIDDQYYLHGYLSDTSLAESDDTYYFLGPHGFYLCAMDKATGAVSVLCNKPDCLHDKEEDGKRTINCNALLVSNVGANKIALYNDKIYTIKKDPYDPPEKNSVYLYAYETDGSGYQKLFEVSPNIDKWIIHRGYLYVAAMTFTFTGAPDMEITEDDEYFVDRYDLSKNNPKPETLFASEGVIGQTMNLFARGTSLYISSWEATDYSDPSTQRNAFRCVDLGTKQIKEYNGQVAVGSTILENGNVICTTNDNKKVLGINTLDPTLKSIQHWEWTVDKGNLFPHTDGTYIYLENPFYRPDDPNNTDYIVLVTDLSGKLLNQLNLSNNRMPIIGVNKDYIFFNYSAYVDPDDSSQGKFMDSIYCIPTSDALNPDAQPQVFYQYDATTNFPGTVVQTLE